MKKLFQKNNRSALSWILKSIKKQYGVLIFIVIATCLLGCAGSVVAVIVGRLVDAATNGFFNSLIGFAVLLGLVYILNIALSAIVKYLTSRCKASIEISMRHNFFDMVLHKDYSKISEYHSGELMNRIISDVSVIADAAAIIVPNFAGLLVRFIFALVLLLYIQPWLALFYTLGGLAVFFVARFFRERIKKLHKTAQKTEDDNSSFWQENLYNLLAVKVFAAQTNMSRKSDALQHKSFIARMNSSKFTTLASTGYSLFISMGYVLAFLWCGFCLFYNIMSFGTMTTIIQLIGQLQSPFSGMSGIFTQYYVAIASAERLMEIERIEDEETVDYADADEVYNKMQSLKVSQLCFAYDREPIFDDISLAVKKGEFVGIIGNSGIGKSTLFKLMLGVYHPDKGNICFEMTGGDLLACTAATRKLFAYVPQGNMMFSGTIRENIMLINPNADEAAINSAVKISCADEFISALSLGIDTEIGEKGLGLSEGQVQRLAIARALVSGAPIILLDEATSALDGETEAKLLKNLRELENVTCIIVTHRTKALSICDRTLKIESGKIILI